MTSHDNVTDIERRYLLQKRGLYYRPDRCGYTGIKEHAGRYFESDATPPDVVAIHEDEAADFSPSCYDDLARHHLQEQIATLRKQLENAREALHSIEGQAVCVALPHKASEADDMLENIAGIAAQALESIYALKGQPC